MKQFLVIAGLSALSANAWASCKPESLAELADASTFGKMSLEVNQEISRSAEGGVFYVFFDSDSRDPFDEKASSLDPGGEIFAMRADQFGHSGSWYSRITFLNSKDFAIREIELAYEGRNYGYNGALVAKATQVDFIFCDGKLYAPNRFREKTDAAKYAVSAEEARKLFFEAPELSEYIKRVRN